MPHKTASERREYHRRYRERHKARLRKQKQKYYEIRYKGRALAWSIKRLGYPEPTRPCPDRCECCGRVPQSRNLALDHDHETGRFRGWLCSACNGGLGALGDNFAGLGRAIDYLLWSTTQ